MNCLAEFCLRIPNDGKEGRVTKILTLITTILSPSSTLFSNFLFKRSVVLQELLFTKERQGIIFVVFCFIYLPLFIQCLISLMSNC